MAKEIKPVFPVTWGIPDEPVQGLLTYHICSDGIYQTKSVAGKGYITSKLEGGIPGLPKGVETVNALERKIPMSVFWEAVEFFREVEEKLAKESMLEAYVLVGYNYDTREYRLSVPQQIVSAASVKYDIESYHKENPGYYIVMDIHSHTSKMGAFFSGTDNNDDKRARFSMVIGNINQIIPSHVIRFCAGEKYYNFTLDDIFYDDLGSESFSINTSDGLKRIVTVTKARESEGYSTSGSSSFGNYSLYENLKQRAMSNKTEFSLRELMGEDW